MPEIAKSNGRRRPWLLGRVIRATAEATADAALERLRCERGAQVLEMVPHPQGNVISDADASRCEAEVKHHIRMHDELVKLLEHFEARAGVSKRQRRRLRQELRLATSLIDRNLSRLKALGVAPMVFPDHVDYSLHEPVRTIPTCVLADEGRVAEVYVRGFTNNGRVVRPAKVAVLKYVPKPEDLSRKETQS